MVNDDILFTFLLAMLLICIVSLIAVLYKSIPKYLKILFCISIIAQMVWYISVPKMYSEQGIFPDEMVYYKQIHNLPPLSRYTMLSWGFWTNAFGSTHILGPMYLMLLYKLVGTVMNVSLVNIAISKISVLFWDSIIRNQFGDKRANFFTFALSFSPMLWVYTSSALRDSLIVFITSITIYYSWRFISLGKLKYVWVAFVWSILLVLTRIYIGVFMIGVCVCLILLSKTIKMKFKILIPIVILVPILTSSLGNFYFNTIIETVIESKFSFLINLPKVFVETMFGPYIWHINEYLQAGNMSHVIMAISSFSRILTLPLILIGGVVLFRNKESKVFWVLMSGNFIFNLLILSDTYNVGVWRQIMPIFPVITAMQINGICLLFNQSYKPFNMRQVKTMRFYEVLFHNLYRHKVN